MLRGVSDSPEGSKILSFLFRPLLVCRARSSISEARGRTILELLRLDGVLRSSYPRSCTLCKRGMADEHLPRRQGYSGGACDPRYSWTAWALATRWSPLALIILSVQGGILLGRAKVRVAPYAKARKRPACLRKLRDEVGRPLIKRHTQVMRLFRSGRYAPVASRLAIVLLLCVGVFFSLLPTRLEVPTAPTTAGSLQVDKGASGDGHPLDGSYLTVPLEEAESVDEGPVNADLLSALFLLARSFRAIIAWLLANCWWHRAFRFVGLDRRWSCVNALEDGSFLGVFRL
jgi:hypothetical protein